MLQKKLFILKKKCRCIYESKFIDYRFLVFRLDAAKHICYQIPKGFFPISHGNNCLKHALSFSFITVNVTGYDLRCVRNGLETRLLLCLR